MATEDHIFNVLETTESSIVTFTGSTAILGAIASSPATATTNVMWFWERLLIAFHCGGAATIDQLLYQLQLLTAIVGALFIFYAVIIFLKELVATYKIIKARKIASISRDNNWMLFWFMLSLRSFWYLIIFPGFTVLMGLNFLNLSYLVPALMLFSCSPLLITLTYFAPFILAIYLFIELIKLTSIISTRLDSDNKNKPKKIGKKSLQVILYATMIFITIGQLPYFGLYFPILIFCIGVFLLMIAMIAATLALIYFFQRYHEPSDSFSLHNMMLCLVMVGLALAMLLLITAYLCAGISSAFAAAGVSTGFVVSISVTALASLACVIPFALIAVGIGSIIITFLIETEAQSYCLRSLAIIIAAALITAAIFYFMGIPAVASIIVLSVFAFIIGMQIGSHIKDAFYATSAIAEPDDMVKNDDISNLSQSNIISAIESGDKNYFNAAKIGLIGVLFTAAAMYLMVSHPLFIIGLAALVTGILVYAAYNFSINNDNSKTLSKF